MGKKTIGPDQINLYKSGFVHIFLLIAIVLIGIAGIGYFAYKNGQLLTPVQNNNVSVSPALRYNEMDRSSWNTYTIPDQQLQFDYPEELEISNYHQPDYEIYEFGTLDLVKGDSSDQGGYMISIKIYPNANKDTGWKKLENYNKEDCSSNLSICSDIQNSHLAGTPAKTYSITSRNSNYTSRVDEYYFENKSNLFVVTTITSTPEEKKYNQPISTILNYFKFLDQKDTDLVKFTDDRFDLSFTHPQLWNVQSTVEGGGESSETYPVISYSLDRYFSGEIIIAKNPTYLDPRKWFDSKKGSYNKIIKEPASLEIDGHPAVAYAQGDSCLTAPFYVVVIQQNDKIYTLSYREGASRSRAVDLETLLKNLKFTGSDKSDQNDIPGLYFPEPPADLVCK